MAEKRKVYHVSKRESDGMWAIRIQGSDTVIKLFSTKTEAETYCQTLGANQQGTILFHNSKGKAKGSIATTQVHKKEAVKVETKGAKPVIAAKPEPKAKPEPVKKPMTEVKAAKPVAAKKPEPKAKSEVKAKAPAKKSAPVKSSTKVVKKK